MLFSGSEFSTSLERKPIKSLKDNGNHLVLDTALSFPVEYPIAVQLFDDSAKFTETFVIGNNEARIWVELLVEKKPESMAFKGKHACILHGNKRSTGMSFMNVTSAVIAGVLAPKTCQNKLDIKFPKDGKEAARPILNYKPTSCN